jgi:hypothetical protein
LHTDTPQGAVGMGVTKKNNKRLLGNHMSLNRLDGVKLQMQSYSHQHLPNFTLLSPKQPVLLLKCLKNLPQWSACGLPT